MSIISVKFVSALIIVREINISVFFYVFWNKQFCCQITASSEIIHHIMF
jgi:hypothetical protein